VELKLPPVPRPVTLDGHEGEWVARRGDKVIASADSSRDLVVVLHQLDLEEREGAVIEFVRPTSDTYVVGAG